MFSSVVIGDRKLIISLLVVETILENALQVEIDRRNLIQADPEITRIRIRRLEVENSAIDMMRSGRQQEEQSINIGQHTRKLCKET